MAASAQSLMKIPSNLRRDDASFRIAERFGIITVKDLTNPIQFYFETDEAMLNTILNKSPKTIDFFYFICYNKMIKYLFLQILMQVSQKFSIHAPF